MEVINEENSDNVQYISSCNGIGVFYDQLQGSFNNIGGKLGFLVCCDIPNIAYAQAGLSFEKLLKDDFTSHPEHYDNKSGNNTPSTIFFLEELRTIMPIVNIIIT